MSKSLMGDWTLERVVAAYSAKINSREDPFFSGGVADLIVCLGGRRLWRDWLFLLLGFVSKSRNVMIGIRFMVDSPHITYLLQ